MQERRTFDLTSHPQFRYSQDRRRFQKVRFAYYLDPRSVSHEHVRHLFLRDINHRQFDQSYYLERNLEKFERFDPDVVIVTATHDRVDRLITLYESILSQRFAAKIGWVIVENGSTNGTVSQITTWAKNHAGVVYLQYHSPLGYAAPARNRGLAFVQWGSRHRSRQRYVWVIDSDDYIHNEFVIKELYGAAVKHPGTMTHGYAVCRYEDTEWKLITMNTIPRNIGSGFPAVQMLKDEFEAGPQVLSALIPLNYMSYFYYPNEFAMEDDTLNRRIMAWTAKQRSKITAIPFPCLFKTFHFRSMSGSNEMIGDPGISVQLGPVRVSGIRAQIVMSLLYVRDYFTREEI